MLLMEGKGSSGPSGIAGIKKQPKDKSVQIPGKSREELKARNDAAVKKAQSPDFEVMPGVTREELKAKNDAAMNAPKPLSVGGNREISSPAGGK